MKLSFVIHSTNIFGVPARGLVLLQVTWMQPPAGHSFWPPPAHIPEAKRRGTEQVSQTALRSLVPSPGCIFDSPRERLLAPRGWAPPETSHNQNV